MKTSTLAACAVAALLLVTHLSPAAEPSVTTPPQGTTYTLTAGETVADVATRFLGGPEYVPELLKFNAIDNPLTIGEGYRLAIPGQPRFAALAALEDAQSVLLDAVAAGAEAYAPAELAEARGVLESARAAWQETAYMKTTSLSSLAATKAAAALSAADRNANVALQATVTATHGAVSAQLTADDKWQPAAQGMTIPVHGSIRTTGGARAELRLPDGSRVIVEERSEVALGELLEDRRTGRQRTRLQLELGEIMGEIQKKKTDDSGFHIEAGESSIAIRGTALRVAKRADETAVMVHKGKVTAQRGKRTVVLEANEGGILRKHGRPRKVGLLPPPRLQHPTDGEQDTASQIVPLAWHPVGPRPLLGSARTLPFIHRGRRAVTYRVELASDAAFNHLVQDVLTKDCTLTTEVLVPGTYYCRIACIDALGLQGAATEPVELTIRRDLSIELHPSVDPVRQAGQAVVRPGTHISAVAGSEDTSVHSIEVSLNNSPYSDYRGPFPIASNGANSIRVKGIGRDGHAGEPTTLNVYVDGKSPDVSVAVGLPQADTEYGQAVTLTVEAVDDTAIDRIEWNDNGTAFKTYTSPVKLDATRSHVLKARAIDIVGNVSPVRKLEIGGSTP